MLRKLGAVFGFEDEGSPETPSRSSLRAPSAELLFQHGDMYDGNDYDPESKPESPPLHRSSSTEEKLFSLGLAPEQIPSIFHPIFKNSVDSHTLSVRERLDLMLRLEKYSALVNESQTDNISAVRAAQIVDEIGDILKLDDGPHKKEVNGLHHSGLFNLGSNSRTILSSAAAAAASPSIESEMSASPSTTHSIVSLLHGIAASSAYSATSDPQKNVSNSAVAPNPNIILRTSLFANQLPSNQYNLDKSTTTPHNILSKNALLLAELGYKNDLPEALTDGLTQEIMETPIFWTSRPESRIDLLVLNNITTKAKQQALLDPQCDLSTATYINPFTQVPYLLNSVCEDTHIHTNIDTHIKTYMQNLIDLSHHFIEIKRLANETTVDIDALLKQKEQLFEAICRFIVHTITLCNLDSNGNTASPTPIKDKVPYLDGAYKLRMLLTKERTYCRMLKEDNQEELIIEYCRSMADFYKPCLFESFKKYQLTNMDETITNKTKYVIKNIELLEAFKRNKNRKPQDEENPSVYDGNPECPPTPHSSMRPS